MKELWWLIFPNGLSWYKTSLGNECLFPLCLLLNLKSFSHKSWYYAVRDMPKYGGFLCLFKLYAPKITVNIRGYGFGGFCCG